MAPRRGVFIRYNTDRIELWNFSRDFLGLATGVVAQQELAERLS